MGEVFAGRYELADPIGRGGVGAVWRAWDHRRRRYVAAKVLQQSDAHTLLRFVREQALRIDHPHVLAPASWAADDDKVLFTMDLVAGGSLAHLIGDYGPLPPQFVCVLLDQLLSGLAAVHAEGVVHRDIKPANILLEATGTGLPHLRVSDFGIAMRKGEPRLTEANYVVGTPGYFAPEQAMGADPDFPADLFAAGLVALYLLEGAKPDAQALIEHFAEHGTPGAPVGVPGPLWGVLAGLLQPDPDARFRTATGARKALLSAAELLQDPSPDDELIEVFDQLGPLPPGFGPNGPAVRGRRGRPLQATTTTPVLPSPTDSTPSDSAPEDGSGAGAGTGAGAGAGAGAELDPSPDLESGHGYSRGLGLGPEPESEPFSGQGPKQAPEPAPAPAPEPASDQIPDPTPEPSVPSMSETGSFHLPPPAPLDEQSPSPSPTPLDEQIPPAPSVPPMPSARPAAPAPLPEPPRHQPTPAMPTAAEPTAVPPSAVPPSAMTPSAAESAAVEPTPAEPTPADPTPAGPAPAEPVQPTPPAQPVQPVHVPRRLPHTPHIPTAHSLSPSPHPAHAVTTVVPYQQDRHSLYTARSREVPRRSRAVSEHQPGPPRKVTIPVLFIAALCFAVGIWALTQT
ncbi:protein kinase domain-containing protein [Streptomyces sp. YJ-C3]